MRIGFLFNHYAPHQVLHSAPIAFALSQNFPEIQVSIIGSNHELIQEAKSIGQNWVGHRCDFIQPSVPMIIKIGDFLLRNFFSFQKRSFLMANLDLFKKFDVLVVPEKYSLRLKKIDGLGHLKFVRIRHGAGDRETGLDESNQKFDLILASGQKMKDRLIRNSNIKEETCKIIGYPKFDGVMSLPKPTPIFNNGKPTVIYNPHFERNESSWVAMGMDILEFFKSNQNYNLIFAPHIMLYKRKLRHGARNLSAYKHCPNIHIDTGSAASVNMTYTRQADIYLGDVSSQVYEFLIEPRPCIFLNAHDFNWENDEKFLNWQKAGQVVNNISQLSTALGQAQDLHTHYKPLQEVLITYTFDLQETPSAVRAANAIADFVK